MVHLQQLDQTSGVYWAQLTVTAHHYLRKPVDMRAAVEGYEVLVDGVGGRAGALLVCRPQATRCGTWYGDVADVAAGRCEVTRWQVLNLARVWLDPVVQYHGNGYRPELLPGYIDRQGQWRSTLASEVLHQVVQRVGYDYLMSRPPVFPDEPYEVRWLLSYCDTKLHKGTIYRAAGFERYSINKDGIETWRIQLPALTAAQHAEVLKRAEQHPRSRAYRARRAAGELAQLALEVRA